ncbi:MAG: YkgJ family cysteine cluster protein [Anaerolineae bacterium]|nr:YkgJ family cysteine cluster protein [Anaerolineae bacterium]
MSQATKASGEELCKSCGLCCQGVFHSDAELYSPSDTNIARRIGAKILDENSPDIKFQLPCNAFNGCCSAYPTRPSVCASHHCDLLIAHLAGQISKQTALERSSEMQELTSAILPKLHALTGTLDLNQPEKLMAIALESFPDDASRMSFKSKNRKLLLQLGRFMILKNKHFYKNS